MEAYVNGMHDYSDALSKNPNPTRKDKVRAYGKAFADMHRIDKEDREAAQKTADRFNEQIKKEFKTMLKGKGSAPEGEKVAGKKVPEKLSRKAEAETYEVGARGAKQGPSARTADTTTGGDVKSGGADSVSFSDKSKSGDANQPKFK